MKYIWLLYKNVMRNRRRTLLTVTSIAVSLFLVTTLLTLLNELQNPIETPASALRLITRHKVSLFNSLPIAYRQKIAKVDGVEAVMGSMWFGGVYKDPSNFFGQFAADTEQFLRSLAPDLEYHMWEGVDHFLHLEKAKEFNETVIAFADKKKLLK